MTNHYQIVNLFEEEHLTINEIAQVLDVEPEAIKFCLATHSSKFQKSLSLNSQKIFSNSDFESATRVMSGLMFSEHDTVRLKAAKFVLNENLGRHDLKNLKSVNINVNLINDQVRKAKEAIRAGREKVIDIPMEVKHLQE